jgi:sugar lactone lactonase YvrE
LAVDAARNVYVVDRSNVDIRKITPEGVVTTFAGVSGQTGSADGTGAAAQFYTPEELTVDSAGNIYLVEFGNSTVRKIAPNGTNWIVTTLAGCASCAVGTNDGVGIAAHFNNPFGLTRDSSGNVYVADTNSRTIRKITPNGTNWTVTTFAGKFGLPTMDGTGIAAGFNGPIGLAIDAANNLYVADGFAIRKITPAAVVTTLAGCPPPGCTNAIGSADGPGSVARFGLPRGVAVDGAGNIYVADSGNNTIRKLTLSGSTWMVTTLAGTPGPASGADGVGSEARFNQPSGIAVDSAGSVYVVDSGENRVTKGRSVSLSPSFQFGTSPGSLTVSNGAFRIRLSSSSSTNVVVVVEASVNLQIWTPIQTNTVSSSGLDVSVLVGTNQHRFFRARLGP